MSPAIWKPEEFKVGGLKGITRFSGRMTDIDEDVEGKFGPQVEIHWEDVEVLESTEEVVCKDGLFTSWVGQKAGKNTTNSNMIDDWADFAKQHDLGPIPNGLFGVNIVYKRIEYDFGDDMNPGKAYIPVELVDEAPKGGTTRSRGAVKEAPPEEEEAPEISDALTKVVVTTAGEKGATREMLRREVVKKSALRVEMGKVEGGLDTILTELVASEVLSEDNGTYYAVGDGPF